MTIYKWGLGLHVHALQSDIWDIFPRVAPDLPGSGGGTWGCVGQVWGRPEAVPRNRHHMDDKATLTKPEAQTTVVVWLGCGVWRRRLHEVHEARMTSKATHRHECPFYRTGHAVCGKPSSQNETLDRISANVSPIPQGVQRRNIRCAVDRRLSISTAAVRLMELTRQT